MPPNTETVIFENPPQPLGALGYGPVVPAITVTNTRVTFGEHTIVLKGVKEVKLETRWKWIEPWLRTRNIFLAIFLCLLTTPLFFTPLFPLSIVTFAVVMGIIWHSLFAAWYRFWNGGWNRLWSGPAKGKWERVILVCEKRSIVCFEIYLEGGFSKYEFAPGGGSSQEAVQEFKRGYAAREKLARDVAVAIGKAIGSSSPDKNTQDN